MGMFLMLAAAVPACAASDAATNDPAPEAAEDEADNQICVPGHQTTCACPGGGEGVQQCHEDGSGLGACTDCSAVSEPPPEDPGPTDPCGDGMCMPGEDCHSCVADCGTCEPCNIAPSCMNAAVPPADLPHATDFDVPKMEWQSPEMLQQRLSDWVMNTGENIRVLAAALDTRPASNEHPFVTSLREVFYDHPEAADALRRSLNAAGIGSAAQFRAAFPELRLSPDTEISQLDVEYPGGSMECGAPLLRVGISSITVHEEDDDFANDIVYCVVQAESMTGAEIRVTPQTPNLDEGDSFTFALESGVFWGQQGPTTPAGNMLITYDCIEADTSGGYQALVSAIGQAAGQVGNVVEGENGWVFSTAAAIAPVVSTGLALDTDDHLFNAQQTIPLDSQLALTNGAYWTVRRDGTHIFSDWDWELTVQAWGCAEFGTL
jgi:hypothetical protein